MKKAKVLLIDDDELFIFLTTKILRKAPCLEKLDTMESVDKAKVYLSDCEKNSILFPDIIFVDMNMPKMNGMEFAQFYNEQYAPQHQETKLIILTSSISRKEKEKALFIPAVHDFMQKPLTVDMLNSLILQ